MRISAINFLIYTFYSLLQGSLQQVGPRFLEQTLDKKLMSMLRVSRFYKGLDSLTNCFAEREELVHV